MKWIYVLLTCRFSAACADKHEFAGAEPIPKQEMTAILWDIMQVDEFATSFIARDSMKNLKLERIKLYQQVFQLHKISDKEFSASFKYYSGHPDMMKVLFDSLGTRADRERQKTYMPDSANRR